MTYIVRTIDRCFTEAHYSCFSTMVRDWSSEILAGSHYFMVLRAD
jgi:hypothetical protein